MAAPLPRERRYLLAGLALVCFALVLNFDLTNPASSPTSSPTTPPPPSSLLLLQQQQPSDQLIPPSKLPQQWNRDFPAYHVDYSQPVHFTHVFSSYSLPSSSSSSSSMTDEQREVALVQYSWVRAALYAKRVKNIQVEFLDCTLATSTASSPPFATRHNLTWLVPDIRSKRSSSMITTVGEYYKIAREQGRGEYVVSTNMDIGVMEDFYVRAHAWASRDYTAPEAQRDAVQASAELYAACYIAKQRDSSPSPLQHVRLCAEDARAVHVTAGGLPHVWDSVKRDVALLACKLALQANSKLELSQLVQMAKLVVHTGKVGSSSALSITDKASILNFEPKPAVATANNNNITLFFAGTITRMDLADGEQLLLRGAKSKELAYLAVNVKQQGEIHPGNDCFVATRLGLPRALTHRFPHPTGVRPFGTWIPLMFAEVGVPFRRISATKRNAWTWHVGRGLWGGAQDQYKQRAEANPLFFLFMAGNFNLLSQSRSLLEWHYTKAPQPCLDSTVAFRQQKYCGGAGGGGSSGGMCVGSMRLACSKYQSLALRDAKMYLKQCQALYAASPRVKEPVCSLCNFFFSAASTGQQQQQRRFTCVRGKMDAFCRHLPDEACAHLPDVAGGGGVAVAEVKMEALPTKWPTMGVKRTSTTRRRPTIRRTKRPTANNDPIGKEEEGRGGVDVDTYAGDGDGTDDDAYGDDDDDAAYGEEAEEEEDESAMVDVGISLAGQVSGGNATNNNNINGTQEEVVVVTAAEEQEWWRESTLEDLLIVSAPRSEDDDDDDGIELMIREESVFISDGEESEDEDDTYADKQSTPEVEEEEDDEEEKEEPDSPFAGLSLVEQAALIE